MRPVDAKLAQHIANVELSPDEAGIVQWVLSHTPTIEVRPVVHGRWVDDTFCSNCGGFSEDADGHIILSFSDYCPNCGAKMDGERRSGDEHNA